MALTKKNYKLEASEIALSDITLLLRQINRRREPGFHRLPHALPTLPSGQAKLGEGDKKMNYSSFLNTALENLKLSVKNSWFYISHFFFFIKVTSLSSQTTIPFIFLDLS